MNCVLRWLSSSVGITAGIHRVCSTVSKCWSFPCSAEKFPRDTEHSGDRELQPVKQWVGKVVRRAEGFVWPSWYHNNGRAGAYGRNERWGRWVCRRGSTVVTCMARLEKYRDVSDKSCRVVVVVHTSELRSIPGISHSTRVNVSVTFHAHSLAVCCCRTAASVCRASAGVVCPGRSVFSAVLRCARQQQQWCCNHDASTWCHPWSYQSHREGLLQQLSAILHNYCMNICSRFLCCCCLSAVLSLFGKTL